MDAIGWIFVLLAIPAICRLIWRGYLATQHPESYMQLKQLEEQKKQRRHESTLAGARLGASLMRIFMR